MLRDYGVDLLEEFEEMSCRRLGVLVNGLPSTAAIYRVEGQQWTAGDEIAALTAEQISQWGLVAAYQHGNKKFNRGLPDQPLKIPRPGEAEKRDRVVTDPREIRRFFS